MLFVETGHALSLLLFCEVAVGVVGVVGCVASGLQLFPDFDYATPQLVSSQNFESNKVAIDFC